MKNARVAEDRLGTMTKIDSIVTESVRAVEEACVQAVELYGS